MTLYANWRDIARRAWSFRLMALAVLLSVAEVILPLFQSAFPVGMFAALTAITVAGAMIARLVAQKDI